MTKGPALSSLLPKAGDWSSLHRALAQLDRKAQGDAFELLCRHFLQWHPAYSQLFEEVWLEADIPLAVRRHCHLPRGDKGLDGLARTRDGRYFGIQCKFLSQTKGSLSRQAFATATDQAFTQSRHISGLVLMTTLERITAEAARYRYDVIQVTLGDWEELQGDSWEQFTAFIAGQTDRARPTPLLPRPHQAQALQHARTYFLEQDHSRGKLIHPCGAGKSLTGFWLAQELGARSVVVAVPSLTLVRQTYRTWLREFCARNEQVDWLAVCSDRTVGRLSQREEDDVVGSLQELGVDAHTDPAFIADWLSRASPRRKVVFTTYQSGEALSEGVRRAGFTFDAGIFDEAHKTVGQSTKLFSHLLHDEHIPVCRRIFMTATERVFRGAGDEILSMDDPEVYGETFDFFSFKQAIASEPPVLTDYKVLVLAVTQAEIRKHIEDNVLIRTKGVRWDEDVEASMLASLIALNKAHRQFGIRHTVSFHASISRAVAFRENQERFNGLGLFAPMDTYHVTGRTSTSERNREIQAFASSENALITNARCLTEGVDVPNIDCVLFADPRQSKVDIVQAVGRALRLAPNKRIGHILVPIVIDDEDPGEFSSNPAYRHIIAILRSLATLDERMIEEIKLRIDKEKTVNAPSLHIEGYADEMVSIDLHDLMDKVTVQSWEWIKRIAWMPFHQARAYVHDLKLKSSEEWILYTRGQLAHYGPKPVEIPATPQQVYSKEWKGFGDWLGTGTLAPGDRVYRPFDMAREYVRSLKLTSTTEWRTFARSGKLPLDIPRTPRVVYANEGWVNEADWIGVEPVIRRNVTYRSFEEARAFAQGLGLKSQTAWNNWLKMRQKPIDIPSNPKIRYKEYWKGWGDWLGTGKIDPRNITYLPYEQARLFAMSLKLANMKSWLKFIKENPRFDIPTYPDRIYAGKGWVNWDHWLGTNNAKRNRTYMLFDDAKKFARSLHIKTRRQWNNLYSQGFIPKNIPKVPDVVYKEKGWVNWGDWLGTGFVSSRLREFWDFETARSFVRNLKLKNSTEWVAFRTSNERPIHLPANPSEVYRDKGWVSMFDWLGIPEKSTSSSEFLEFNQAREYVHKLNLASSTDWVTYCRSGDKPLNIPSSPNRIYKDKGWVSWPDWIGTYARNRPRKKFKEFQEARAFVWSLNLANADHWLEYCKTGKRPTDIPAAPNVVYKDQGWISWSDWLREGVLPPRKDLLPFEEARAMVHTLGIQNRRQWEKALLSGSIPENIPHNPRSVYKDKWSGWGDWLGTYRKGWAQREYLPLVEVMALVRQLGIRSIPQWNRWAKSERPENIPAHPQMVYKDKGWVSWAVFLGKGGKIGRSEVLL